MTPQATLDGAQPLIVELLVKRNLLDSKKLETLREAQSKETSPVEQLLVQKNLVSDREVAQAYAEHLSVPFYEPPETGPVLDKELSRLLPEKMCRDQLIVPIAARFDAGRGLRVAARNADYR